MVGLLICVLLFIIVIICHNLLWLNLRHVRFLLFESSQDSRHLISCDVRQLSQDRLTIEPISLSGNHLDLLKLIADAFTLKNGLIVYANKTQKLLNELRDLILKV